MTARKRTSACVVGLIALLSVSVGSATAGTIVITPSNLENWSLFVTDNNGGVGNNPTGSTTFVTGPQTPPLGVGSLNLSTGDGTTGGDASAQARNSGYSGTLVSGITALSYSTYITSNNGQQAPYFTLYVAFNGDSTYDDRFIFEPTYAGQGTVNQGQWQNWNLLSGKGWYDDLGLANSAPGDTSTVSLAALVVAANGSGDSNPTIVNPSNTLGGVRFTSGFASPGDVFNTNIDAFTINTTTYDFEPLASVPEPASMITLAVAAATGLGYSWLGRRKSKV